MPTYEYSCRNSHTWELTRYSTDNKKPTRCPDCKKSGVLRLSAGSMVVREFSDKERAELAIPFGEKARNFKRAADVEAALDNFHQRYPGFGRPSSTPTNG